MPFWSGSIGIFEGPWSSSRRASAGGDYLTPAAGHAFNEKGIRVVPGVLRPGSWTKPTGGSPVPVGAGALGSRPGSSSRGGGLSGASRALRREQAHGPYCHQARVLQPTTGEPSRSCHGEGEVRRVGVPEMRPSGPPGVRGSARVHGFVSEQERAVCAASSAKTGRISRW
jgi:hypothetical protein